MTKKQDVRAVAADRALETGVPAAVGELVSVYTATRAWRGHLAAQTPEMLLLTHATIVWTADESSVNHGASKYFIIGRTPRGQSEESSGARVVCVARAGVVYVCAHGVRGDVSVPEGLVTPDGLPAVGTVVHACSVTHEFRGRVSLVSDEWLRLDNAAMVNSIPTGDFGDVLAGKAEGDDHVRVAPVSLALHAVTAWAVL